VLVVANYFTFVGKLKINKTTTNLKNQNRRIKNFNKMEKVIRNNYVAVLISHGFGAGWYSWNGNLELLFNPKLVEMVEQNRNNEIDEEWIKENIGIEDVYCGGVKGLQIHWIPVGTAFEVVDYDGAESLRTSANLILVA